MPRDDWLIRFANTAGLSADETRELSAWVQARDSADTLDIDDTSRLTNTVTPAPQPAVVPKDFPHDPAARYSPVRRLGSGGMGEVWRVHDKLLRRTAAMKIVRAELQDRPEVLSRFVEEAEATAQLQHPGIVAVHDLGRLPDGRLYFVMREIEGRDMRAVIEAVHHGVETEWTFRRLVDALARTCDAIAYAHARGVVHRDLKPSNLMLGPFGEVLVVDWGLAALRSHAGAQGVVTSRAESGAAATRYGSIAGTPAYMAPEQARGATDVIGPATDVYALGATLYALLAGRPPFDGDPEWIVLAVPRGPPPLVPRLGDVDLAGLCSRVMSLVPAHRGTAAELGAALRDWLDGAQRRDRALALAADAQRARPRADELVASATDLRTRAEQAWASIASWDPPEAKHAVWALEDRATALERQAQQLELDAERGLHGALSWDPTLPQAHASLARLQRLRHSEAEAARDEDERMRAETLLRAHVDALPAPHAERDSHLEYLDGSGALTLVTDPPAHATLYRFEERHRRLEPMRGSELGQAPLHRHPLPMGSYLVELRADGHETVRYPVHITRQLHWDGVAPGASEPTPVRLPRTGELGPDDRYVPAGWFQAGSDGTEVNIALPPGRLWVGATVFRRFPVTMGEYLAWLDHLVDAGQTERALRHAPRSRGQGDATQILGFDGHHFALVPDEEGDLWDVRWPVFLVDQTDAEAYAAWLAEREGVPWRLPDEVAWEKAARGVDGRVYPWGDRFDHAFTNISQSSPIRAPRPVDATPLDVSVYGIEGMAGNVIERCSNPYAHVPVLDDAQDPPEDSPTLLYAARGGAWSFAARGSPCADRKSLPRNSRWETRGFRLCRSLRTD